MKSNILTISDLIAEGLGEVKTGPFGTALKAAEYQPTGYPVIAVKDIRDGFLEITSDTPRINKEKAQELSPYILQYGDILFGRKGAIDRFAFIREHEAGVLMGSDCIRLRLTDINEARFLAIYFRTSQHKRWMIRNAEGSTMASLNQRIIERIEIPYCTQEIKNRAIEAASALDDKIELNRRMNQTLEVMTQAIFQSWFVDFDPVKAKMAAIASGRDPERAAMAALAGKLVVPKDWAEISVDDLDAAEAALDQLSEQQWIQLAQTSALFPAELIESELGLIPHGWKIKSLGEHVNVIKGRSYSSSELQESRTALVTLKSFMRGGGYREDGLKPFIGEYNPEQEINPGELIISYTDVTQNADVVGQPAIVRSTSKFDTLVASLDVGIIRPSNEQLTIHYLYFVLKDSRFQHHAYAYCSGTTVLHLSKEAVPRYQVVIPKLQLVEKFSLFAKSSLDFIDKAAKQVHTLAESRDTLLPKLLSGELMIPETEEMLD